MKTLTEEIVEDRIGEEQARWQKAIYELLLKMTGADDKIDGACCDSGDPLEFTLTEIGQGLGFFRDQAVDWTPVETQTPPHGIPVWLWSKEWVDEDFNPTGIREGHFIEGEGYTSCGWDPCGDVFTTDEESIPTMFAYKRKPHGK